jgi:hypothetical protein
MAREAVRRSKSESVKLIRQCLEQGRLIITKHFREELANEHLSILDAHYVLQHGNVFNEPEFDAKHREWSYRIEGTAPDGKYVGIVFAFKADELGTLITIFSIRTC